MNRQDQENCAEAGFTTLELMIVVTIIGMMTVLAVQGFTDQIPHQQLNGASREMIGQFRLARQKAIAKGEQITIQFSPDSNAYGDPDSGDKPLPTHIRFGVPDGVNKPPKSATALPQDGISFAGNDLVFKSDGTVLNWGTVYLTNSRDEAVAIAVNAMGRAKQYRWNGDDWE